MARYGHLLAAGLLAGCTSRVGEASLDASEPDYLSGVATGGNGSTYSNGGPGLVAVRHHPTPLRPVMHRIAVVLALLSLACGPDRPGGGPGPSGPTCFDGQKNGQETDVDCGGTCGPCANGKSCGAPADCASDTCTSGVCAAPAGCGGEDDEAFCSRLEKTCGPLSGLDVCGEPKTADCGTCPREITCNGAPTSGVPAGMKIGALTELQEIQLCDHLACAWGGYGGEVECDEGMTVGGADDLEECRGELESCPEITVGDFEGCQKKVAGDACNAFEILFSAPECAAVRTCLN